MKISTAARILSALAMLPMTGIAARAAAAPTAEEDSFDLRQVLLRESSVTVSPGQWQIDAGLNYSRYGTTVSLEGDQATTRNVSFDTNLRLGITPRLEVFAGIPLVRSSKETPTVTTTQQGRTVTVTQGSEQDSASGFGDAGLGASITLAEEGDSLPGTIFTIAASFPTGSNPYEDQYGAGTGSGSSTYRAALNFVRSSDPIVIYWGGGWQYSSSFDAWDDSSYKPGSALLYNFGIGFAVNRDASLIAAMNGAYQFETERDGETIEGSQADPMMMKIGVTTRIRHNLYLEPALSFGITDDAPDFIVGTTLIGRGLF